MRVLNERGLDLPRRDYYGDLRWARATVASVASILKNPAYAGAYAFGKTVPKVNADGTTGRTRRRRAVEEKEA